MEPTQALDYRAQYPNGYPARNPLTTGQMLMIGAATLAVGGLGFWGFQAYKKNKAKKDAESAAVGPAPAAGNPAHFYPRAA